MKNFNKVLKYICAVAILSFGFAACNEDKGNYNYTEVVRVDSVLLGAKGGTARMPIFSMPIGATLKITPKVYFSVADTPDETFDYAYYYDADKGSDRTWTLLSSGLVLEHEVAEPLNVNRDMAFVATNKATGSQYIYLFQLSIMAKIGFVTLGEKTSGYDLDLVGYNVLDAEHPIFEVSKNMLENGGSAIARDAKPRELHIYPDLQAPYMFEADADKYAVFILTDKFSSRLKSADLSWKPQYEISKSVEANSYLDVNYVKAGKPIIADKLHVDKYDRSGSQHQATYMYLTDEDGESNWYINIDYPFWRMFANRVNVLSDADNAERFTPGPYITTNNDAQGAIMWDTDRKRFLRMDFAYSGAQSYIKGFFYAKPMDDPNDDSGFNINDPKFVDVLWMGERMRQRSATNPNVMDVENIIIVKQDDDAYRLLDFRMNNSGLQGGITKYFTCVFPAGSHIAEFKFITIFPGARVDAPYNLYYVTKDNKVYAVDISNSPAIEKDITSTFVRDSYTEITQFKFLYPSTAYGTAPESLLKCLAVGTYDAGKGLDTGGKLELFLQKDPLTGVMELANYPTTKREDDQYQIPMSFDGLSKIIDIDYKKK